MAKEKMLELYIVKCRAVKTKTFHYVSLPCYWLYIQVTVATNLRLMKNLRGSTTNMKVCAYHKEFYRPENLCCILVGRVEPEKVFQALIPVEERILQEIVSKLNEIKESITKPDKMVVNLALNLDNMKRKVVPEEVWLKEFLPFSISPGFMEILI